MTPRRERLCALAIAGAAGLLGAGTWFFAAPWLALPAPAAPTSVPAAVEFTAHEPAATGSPAVAAPVAVREPGQSRVYGLLCDAAGGPVVGFTVQIWQRRPQQPWPPSRDRLGLGPDAEVTDAEGHFAFDGLGPGEYLLRCAAWQEVEAALTVGPGDDVEVELRLPSDVAVVTGSLWQDGALADGYQVAFYSADDELFVRWQEKGTIRCLLRAGCYELRIGTTWSHRAGIWFSRQPLVVPAGTRVLAWRHEVGGTPCDVLVRDEAGAPDAVIGIDVNRAPSGAGRHACFAQQARIGAWHRLWLPAGRWRVHVHGEGLAAMPERVVFVEPGSPPQRLEFVARPGATVDLVLRDAAGLRVWIVPELVPPLLACGQARPCTVRKTGSREGSLAFQHVPFGNAELRLEDGEVDGTLSFVPFEPLPPVAWSVHANAAPIRLVVQRRPFVDLRACDATGREDTNACIMVFRGDRRVRGRDETHTQRWAAWLPAGEYRAAVDRGGAVREYPFPVGTRNVALRLRP